MQPSNFIYISPDELRKVIRSEVTAIVREEIKQFYNTISENDNEMFLDIDEAAAFTKLSKHTLRKKAQQRKIPSIKVDGKWMFEKQALKEYILQGKRKTNEELKTFAKSNIKKIMNEHD